MAKTSDLSEWEGDATGRCNKGRQNQRHFAYRALQQRPQGKFHPAACGPLSFHGANKIRPGTPVLCLVSLKCRRRTTSWYTAPEASGAHESYGTQGGRATASGSMGLSLPMAKHTSARSSPRANPTQAHAYQHEGPAFRAKFAPALRMQVKTHPPRQTPRRQPKATV